VVDVLAIAAYLLSRMAAHGIASQLLSEILPRVSRSFSLSIRILPQSMRRPIGLAYLFCRAADTIADTALLPPDQRLAHLEQYRAAFGEPGPLTLASLSQQLTGPQQNPAERELLARLPDCGALFEECTVDDQQCIRALVLTLTQGMQMDLRAFPREHEGRVGALETRADLDRYIYLVAGCVGEFWTKVAMAHLSTLRHWDVEEMAARGVQFGKGLQMTNILRDLAQDLRSGRCYLPRVELARLGVQPEELLRPETLTRVQPLLTTLLNDTLAFYRDGWKYTLAIPPRAWRLRLACAWPLLIGVSTLAMVKRSSQLLDPAVRIKIARSRVYSVMLRSCVVVWSNPALGRYYRRVLAEGGLTSSR
jgi:farnesyl-diphosphate farnesyltransferase